MLAIDGSDASNAAIQEVLKLVKAQDVHVRVIHVVDESFIHAGGPIFDYAPILANLRWHGQGLLDLAAKTIENETSIKVEKFLLETQVLQGRIAKIIIKEAQDWPADLLVLGTHGRRGFSRFVLGSVAENIMRIATMPLLLVHASQIN